MKQITNRQLLQFFGITFAFSWLLWIPAVLKSNGYPDLPDIVGLPGMFAPFGPAIAAFWLLGRQEGREGVKKLWKRGWNLDFDKKWLLPTIFLMPLISLVTVGIFKLMGLSIEWEHGIPLAALVPIFFYIYLLNALPEEYGWRGYALGPLLNRYSALVASLILGAIWGLWHLPLHFIEGTTQAAIPVYQFILQQMVLAIFYTWLFNNTHGSVFIAILFHTIANVVGGAIPYWTTDQGRWIGFAIQVVFAVIIVLIWGPKHLNRSIANRYNPTSDPIEEP